MVQSDISWAPDDTLRVLIASDIHLGYHENDAIRGEDSFIAFEEVLSLAVQYDVDFILLGGDLFDQAKPSPSCMYKCTQIIRKFCFGDKPINIEIVSDQLQNFSRNINYEDPNLNVSYPILSIHGNHDDPVGQNSVSSLDILSITGLVNYFGKWTDYTKVKISPVLIQKGETKLSLYGLSHLKDQRLARLFAEKKVEIESMEDSSDWFNILVLHQNRADRGPNNYISEGVLPKFLDLVIWGHEHDSQIFPIRDTKRNDSDGFFVIQPGSTVATSLAAGEALPKHCALLQLHKNDYIVTPIPLKTVRPFIFKTVVLSEENLGEGDVNETEKVQNFLKIKIEEAIEEATKQRSGDPKQPTLPLIRLSVFYERDAQDFNRIRFGQNFNRLIANPNDVLIMKKEKKIRDRKENMIDDDVHIEVAAAEAPDVESLVRSYYAAQPPTKQLSVLSVKAITEAVRDFTMKRDDEVFRRVLDAHRRRCVESLLESTAETEEEISDRMRMCKEVLDAADSDQLKSLIDAASAKEIAKRKDEKQLVVLLKREPITVSSEDEGTSLARSKGRARGGRARAKSGRGKAPAPPPERRTPKRSAAMKNPSWLQTITSDRALRPRKDLSDIEISD